MSPANVQPLPCLASRPELSDLPRKKLKVIKNAWACDCHRLCLALNYLYARRSSTRLPPWGGFWPRLKRIDGVRSVLAGSWAVVIYLHGHIRRV